MDRIPLFPLRAVLFPGSVLALRVFEPRYHRLLEDCEREGTAFGVVLIREGPEVGGYAEPFDVGTLARVERRVDQAGEAHLLVRGGRRFRVARTLRERPYLEAKVDWLPEPDPREPAHAPEAGHGHAHMPLELEVAALFDDYVHRLAEVTRVPVEPEVAGLFRGPRTGGPWAMACAVGGALLARPEEKQAILEAARVHDALHVERELLAREAARLRVLARSAAKKLN